MVVLWLTFLIFHLCYYFSSPLLQLFKCHCVEVMPLLTGSFHGSFHVLHSIIDASCEAKKCIPRRAVFKRAPQKESALFASSLKKNRGRRAYARNANLNSICYVRCMAILHYQDKVSFITSQPPSLTLNPPLPLPFSPTSFWLWWKPHS